MGGGGNPDISSPICNPNDIAPKEFFFLNTQIGSLIVDIRLCLFFKK